MIRIEYETPVLDTCECCGGASVRLTRFVYDDNDAHAVYYALLSDVHPHEVKATVSIGIWWEGGTPADRTAFALRLWQDHSQFGVTVDDAANSPWRAVELLGRMLNRDEAIVHPRIGEVFHITDHIFADDPEVREFFARHSSTS
jgi:hypothetical protein